MPLRFYAIVAVGILAISMSSIFIKLCDAPALVIAFFRLAFASAMLTAGSVWIRKPLLPALRGHNPIAIMLAGILLSAHFATWISSLKYISVATSVVLVSSSPIFVGIASAVFLREAPGRWLVAGIVLTMAGCLVICLTSDAHQENALLGYCLALSGAISMAGYLILGRSLRQRIDTFGFIRTVYGIAAVAMFLVVNAFDLPLFEYAAKTYFLMFLVAFFPQMIGHTSLNWALAHVSATTVSIISLGEPIVTPALAFWFLGEEITAIQIIGGMLILFGVLLSLWGELQRQKAGTG